MSLTKASVLVFVLVAILMTLFMVKLSQGEAAPSSPTDGSKVPHYFGPNPNWALSPLTLPDATVTITTTGSHDVTATAQATVGFANGANGVITGITITNPGAGYTSADVVITGAGSGAAASAVVTTSTAVTAVNVTGAGAAYTKPLVTISGGGGTTQATATAYGGVDAITITSPGAGYTFPTVDFDAPNDPNGTPATAHATIDALGVITAIVIDNPGSGYSSAPSVVVRDGTLMDPINNAGAGATATATLKILSVGLDTYGAGYTSAPSVAITESAVGGLGSGATATAVVDAGTISAINITNGGSGYFTPGGIKKFQDALPGLCDPAGVAAPVCLGGATDKYIPLGVPEAKAYLDPNGKPIMADEYEIGVVQYRTKFNADLPATLVRGYVQLETPSWVTAHPGVSQHFPLVNVLRNGTEVPVTENNAQVFAVTRPQWLGPTIAATKNKPVRIVFHNLLPIGVNGNLFLPTDTTLMGSGTGPIAMPAPVNSGTVTDEVRNPVCTDNPQDISCFKQNRATLHLHGGLTPWISDGTPHQWITPANENTPWPQGVSVQNVPDMDVGNAAGDGIQTFYYTNQQSARLMFYHDHAWGITRLNVYAGEAAGYLISDNTEKTLVTNGTIPGPADTIPLIVQDRTFVPQDSQLYNQVDGSGKVTSYGQDPTWDKSKWGSYGDLWYHHVYMPAQNPGDPSGMSAYGRWMYGPWFWPPAAATTYGPIANPFYDPACHLDVPATWQYQTDPFCEPQQIPGTPNISVGMEQFNDTPIVNGVAYPKVTLAPKTYRLRVLNAANDRFFNFQWYVADPRTGTLSEVALNQSQLNAAQTDPTVFPTPDMTISAPGPDWIQIGSEGGFLPTPVQLTQLLIGPAERADVVVDFTDVPAGTNITLLNVGPDEPFAGGIPDEDFDTADPGTTGQVMQFRVKPATRLDSSLPASELPAYCFKPLGQATGTRSVSLNEEESRTVSVSEDADGNIVFDPTGSPFGPTAAKLGTYDPATGIATPLAWMDPVTESPTVGSTEIWEIHNMTVDAHPIHIHLVQFQVAGREVVDPLLSPHGDLGQGALLAPETWESGYKDTVIAYPGEVTRIKARFDKAGLFVWHCHILEHEDNEMMRPYEVVAAPRP